MRKLLFCLLFFPFLAQAQTNWKIDTSRSGISFIISNFGVDVDGSMASPVGIIQFDEENLANAKFSVKIPVGSIRTGIKKRDNHLLKEEFFDAETFPNIRFISSSVVKEGDQYNVTGQLSIKDITKKVIIPFKFERTAKVGGFQGNFVLSRKDYTLGGGMLPTGDEVKVKILVVVVAG